MSSPLPESGAPAPPVARPRRSWLRFLNCSAWLLLLAGAAFYFYFCEGWRDVTVGRMHRKANDLFTETEGITEVRIFLLCGDPAKKRDITVISRFDGHASVYGSVTLTRDDLNEFLGTWMLQNPSEFMSGFCHEPAYHIQLYRGSRLVAEASMCWKCSNFSFEVWPGREPVLYGFHSKGGAGQTLLEFCDRRLPYWREPPSLGNAPANGGRAGTD